jgi:hypothetical protein
MRSIHAVIPAMCLLVSLQSGSQIADPQAEIIEVPAGDRFLRWQAKAGHTYFIQTSDPNTHLENWIWTPCIESRAVDIAITYEIGTTAEKAFFRIHHTVQSPPPGVRLEDWDADGDGLSNAFELSIQTDPLNPDTSGDGIPDGWAFVHGLNPLLDNSAGFFQSTESTNLAAYQAGVQANPNATLADYDGDFRNNEDDVDPNDADLNWQRAGEASYVLIDLDVPPTAGQARDINDKGEVLFDTGIWSGGEWIPIDAEPYQGIRPGPGENNDSNYEVNASNWMFFNDAGQLTGYADLAYSGGPHSGQIGTVLQWTPGDPYSRHAPSALPFFDYNDGEASPIGISDDGTVFSRFAYPALGGAEPVSTARILVTAANGTHQSLLSGADGWHPIGSHAHSDVSGNGWLVANTASTLNGAADYRLALWNPSQALVSLPAQGNSFFFPLHLADLDEGQLLMAAGTQGGIDSEVFLSESGTTRHLPSLSGKDIRLFAGDGTGITSDGKLWRNGELIPMRDLCQQWDELLDGGWNLEALKANKFGVYLIQATHPQEPEPRLFLLPPVEITAAFGYGPEIPEDGGILDSRQLLEAYLNGIKVGRQGDVWAVTGKNTLGNDRIWGVEIVSDQDKLGAALTSGGRYVVFDGHSNYGFGPDFLGAVNITRVSDFTNYGSKYTDVSLTFRKLLRNPQNPTDPLNFGDTYGNLEIPDTEIALAPKNYKALRMDEERFPNIDGVGLGQAFPMQGEGFDAWHYRNEEGAKRLMINAPKTDLPAKLGYRTFFYNACSSGVDYIENFKHGEFIYTTQSCFVHKGTKVFIQGVVEGKPAEQILPLLNTPAVGGGGVGEIIYKLERF